MNPKRKTVLWGLVLSVFLMTIAVQPVVAEILSASLNPPFQLKITFDPDQMREIENNNDPVKMSFLFDYIDGMVIYVNKSGYVSGQATVHSESSMGNRTVDGTLTLTGSYKSGKITSSWTFSGKIDIPQVKEFYFIADPIFEGNGEFISGVIDKDGGKGYMTGEMEWTHEECDKQDTDTQSPTFGECLQKSTHVDSEPFEINWIAVPVCGNDASNMCECWEDSLARFNAITGTVEIVCNPEITDWEAAGMKVILDVGEHIATRNNSSAILQFADMNTYIMSPNTEIVIETPPEKETKLQLVMGRLWNNTKKLLYEGTMEIETTQAVAGIKGTTLVMETDGTTTTLKVIAGTVEFTSKATGESIMVSTGEQASADAQGLSEITPLDTALETGTWLTYVEDPAILEPSEGAEYLPKDYNTSPADSSSTQKTGFLKNIWDNTLGRVCGAIFPGLAGVILAINSRRKNGKFKKEKGQKTTNFLSL